MKLLDAVVPLFRINNKSEPELTGSGFLVRHLEHRLIVTAAHVADEIATTPLLIPTRDNVLGKIPTNAISTVAPDGDRDKDMIDLAFWKLPDTFAGDLELAQWFVPTVMLQPGAPSEPPRQYSFVGFPH